MNTELSAGQCMGGRIVFSVQMLLCWNAYGAGELANRSDKDEHMIIETGLLKSTAGLLCALCCMGMREICSR